MSRSRKPKEQLLNEGGISKALIEVLAANAFKQLCGQEWHESTIEQRNQFRTMTKNNLGVLRDNGTVVYGNADSMTRLATAMATKPAVTVFDFLG